MYPEIWHDACRGTIHAILHQEQDKTRRGLQEAEKNQNPTQIGETKRFRRVASTFSWLTFPKLCPNSSLLILLLRGCVFTTIQTLMMSSDRISETSTWEHSSDSWQYSWIWPINPRHGHRSNPAIWCFGPRRRGHGWYQQWPFCALLHVFTWSHPSSKSTCHDFTEGNKDNLWILPRACWRVSGGRIYPEEAVWVGEDRRLGIAPRIQEHDRCKRGQEEAKWEIHFVYAGNNCWP